MHFGESSAHSGGGPRRRRGPPRAARQECIPEARTVITWVTPAGSAAMRRIEELYGPEEVQFLFGEGPREILEGRAPE